MWLNGVSYIMRGASLYKGQQFNFIVESKYVQTH